MREKILREIEEERERQVNQEGFSFSHDDQLEMGELALAASTYALPPRKRALWTPSCDSAPMFWPFSQKWYKPRMDSRRRELVIAGALIVAELERIDRAEEKRLHSMTDKQRAAEICQHYFSVLPDENLMALAKEVSSSDDSCPLLERCCSVIFNETKIAIDLSEAKRIVEREAMARWMMKFDK